MFSERVSSTALSGEMANRFFGDRIYSENEIDVSFVSTMRALLKDRIPDGESIYLNYRTIDCNSVRGVSDAAYVLTGGGNYGYSKRYNVVSILGTEEERDSALSKLESGFVSTANGNGMSYRRIEAVTEFYRRAFKVLCFVDDKAKSVWLFIGGRVTLRMWHYLQTGLLATLPWYFKPEDGLSELEMELVTSLAGNDVQKYLSCIERFAETMDFRRMRIEQMLSGFESRDDQRRLAAVRSDIQSIDSYIQDYLDNIATYQKRRREHVIEMMGLEEAIARAKHEPGENVLMEFFLHNRSLIPISLDGNSSRLIFAVESTLEHFDPEAVERVIGNRYSVVYEDACGDDRWTREIREDIELLMRAIFIDEKCKLKIVAKYLIEPGNRVTGRYDSDDGGYPDETRNSIPNPHIGHYRCLGDYQRMINECLTNGNLIGAISQCIASTQSLNWLDGAVMRAFFDDLQNNYFFSSRKCILFPDGTTETMQEAVVRLRGNQ